MPKFSLFGEEIVAQLSPKAGWKADYTVNTRLYSTAGTSGGSVTVDDNRFKLSTTATANRTAVLSTRKRLRYLPGMAGMLRITSPFDTAAPANTYQRVLIGDGEDGFGFGMEGQTFGTLYRRAGTTTPNAQAKFNIDNTVFNNPAYGLPLELMYQWLGYGFVRFALLDPDWRATGFRPVDVLKYPNTSAAVSIKNPSLTVRAECGNAANAYDVVMYTPSAMAFMVGLDEDVSNPLDLWSPFDVSPTFADQNNNHMLTIRNKALYTVTAAPTTVTNKVACEVGSFSIARGTGAALSTIRMYRNATTAGALVYADFDQLNSPLDFSTTTTTVTSTNSERSWGLGASATPPPDKFRPGEIEIPPGESVTFAAQNNGNQSTQFVLTVTVREKY
jgi:hypothetical protein